jgi:hypothetical protein
MMKCESGLLVYMQTDMAKVGPSASGRWARRAGRKVSSSAGWGVRSIVAGSAGWPRAWRAILRPGLEANIGNP